MKIRLASLLVAALLAPATLIAAAAPFEGRVTFKMTPAGGVSQELRFAVKNGRSRVEIPNQQGMGALILDPAKREQIVMLEQQRMYMVMATPEVTTHGDAAKNDEAVTLTKTGETEKILGHTAEKYLATHKDETTELWLAEGLGSFVPFAGGNPMAGGRAGRGVPPQPKAWEKALAEKGAFPLRVVTRDANKRETFRLEATTVEAQSLPDTLFAPPADYRKLDMGGMINGMMPPGVGR